MVRLYSSALHPRQWVAYADGTGWVVFPAIDGGWEQRRPARGIDPVHLREVPLTMAAKTAIPEARPRRRYAKVA